MFLLFTEKKEFDQAKYVPMGTENDSDLTAGQIIHMKIWRFRLTLFIDQFIQAELPATGQTVYGRMAFLGRTGTFGAKSIRDAESHHIQDHFEMRKFWFTTIEDTDIRCIAIDTNSCVVVYQKKSEIAIGLLPRWFTRNLDKKNKIQESATNSYLQTIKAKAEKSVRDFPVR